MPKLDKFLPNFSFLQEMPRSMSKIYCYDFKPILIILGELWKSHNKLSQVLKKKLCTLTYYFCQHHLICFVDIQLVHFLFVSEIFLSQKSWETLDVLHKKTILILIKVVDFLLRLTLRKSLCITYFRGRTQREHWSKTLCCLLFCQIV